VYTIADFSGSTNPVSITPPVGDAGTDLTPFFSFTGAFQTTPTVALVCG
jgi:hypothetical protein